MSYVGRVLFCGPAAVWLACVGVVLGAVGPVFAQAGGPDAARVEIGIGGGWLGGVALGSADASLRANSTSPSPYRLFNVHTRLKGAPTTEVRLGYRLTPRVLVEGSLAVARPELRSTVSADVEGAPGVTVVERLDEYRVGGAVVVLFPTWRVGGVEPFVAGGVDYLRQLHEGQSLVDDGASYHLGGGVRRMLRSSRRGWLSAVGARADARMLLTGAGVSLDDRVLRRAALSGSLFVAF